MSDSEHSEGVSLAPPVMRVKTLAVCEMVACEMRVRANPPNRSQCLYFSNESQFNKYSRAAYLLKMNSGERAE